MRKGYVAEFSKRLTVNRETVVVALVLLAAILTVPGYAVEKAPVKVGFAQEEIGSIGTTKPDYSFHDTLYAKVMWVEDEEQSFGIVSLDMSGVRDAATEAIKKSISDSLGITGVRVIVCPSHTHSGIRVQSEDLAERIGSIAKSARESARPAWIGYSRVEAGPGFVVNRRITINEKFGDLTMVYSRNNKIMEDGKTLDARDTVIDFIVHGAQILGAAYAEVGVENVRDLTNASPRSLALLSTLPTSMPLDGPVDPRLEALCFKDESGNVIGTLVRFACHSTIFRGSRTNQYSADYPGVLCAEVSKATGGAPAHFVQGPCGNTKPFIDGYGKELMVNIGTGLGRLITAEMEKAEFVPLTKIYWDQDVQDFPVAPDLKDIAEEMGVKAEEDFKQMAATSFDPYELKRVHDWAIRTWASGSKRKEGSLQLPFTVIGFNETAIVTMPGEVFAEHGMAIKSRFPGRDIIVTELTDTGSPAYVPTRDAFPRGGYEVGNSALPAGSGERMVEICIRLLERYYE